MGHVPATVIVGAQWGDEGKGKIVDLLAQESDLVCRYQGGPNAGHTIVVDGETYKIRAIPSGIVAGVASAIGAGCVVDPEVLIAELAELESRGHRTDGLVFVSGNAHLIMPWHVALDGARERRLGKLQIGTTRRGIGPAYADKATRIGIRVQDLLDPKILREKVELAAGEKNVWLERVYGIEPFDVEDVVTRTLGHAERLAPYVADTSLLVDRALLDGRRVLFEGAQGTLLDLDHGTYPFVTSSSPIAAGAAVSFGIGPQRIDEVVGVVEGVRHTGRRGAVPERDRRPRAGACPGPRRRVRHRHRTDSPLRLARPRGAPVRGSRQRDHLSRADEARRALGVRRDPGLRPLPATRRVETETSPPTSPTSITAPRCSRRCRLERGAHGTEAPRRGGRVRRVRRGRAGRPGGAGRHRRVARRGARAPALVRVLVVGSGGREHALAWRLSTSPAPHRAPRARRAIQASRRSRPVIPLPPTTRRPDRARSVPRRRPRRGRPRGAPRCGVADDLRRAGIPVFGPSAAAARIEGSKLFAKAVMAAAGVPTAALLDAPRAPCVLKADGLAAGKGVVVCHTEAELAAGLEVARGLGDRVLVEELLEGPELSLLAVCDGTTALALAPSQDYKRAFDGDEGPNTGGMGSFAPAPASPRAPPKTSWRRASVPFSASSRDAAAPSPARSSPGSC